MSRKGLEQVGLALAGRSGSRLAGRLGIPVARDAFMLAEGRRHVNSAARMTKRGEC